MRTQEAPAWVCPSGYEYEITDREPFKMEYLKPEGVVTGRVVLQLHGGGYIGPMKNIYRKFSVRYSRLSYIRYTKSHSNGHR